MNELVQEILIQVSCYFAVMLIPLIIISLLQRGFFWKFLKVKSSFGKLILIKRRGQIRDSFIIGEIKDGFLFFNDKKEGKKFKNRLSFNNDDYRSIYRCLQCNWVDLDEEGRICRVDYKPVSGFDQKKFSDLYIMAEQQPEIGNIFQKIVLICLVIIIVLCVGAIYMGYQGYHLSNLINTALPNLCKGIISGTGVTP